MTEFDDVVQRQKFRLEAEAWGKQLKYYHYNNGIRTIEFNSGDKLVEDTNKDRVRVVRFKGKESLVDRFARFLRGDKW